MVQARIMSIRTLQDDEARIFTISTSRNAIGGIVDTSVFREAVPVRRYKRSQGSQVIAGEDGIRREYRMIFGPDVTINQSDYIYVQGVKHDEAVLYSPSSASLNHHKEVDVRQLSGDS